MPALRDFIKRKGVLEESICSKCCQIVKPIQGSLTLLEAERRHTCNGFSLNTVERGTGNRVFTGVSVAPDNVNQS
jgi:hypothetical protein